MPPPSTPGLMGKMVNYLAGKLGSKDSQGNANKRIGRLGMSPRQIQMNHLWSVYKGLHYANRKVDWNGHESADPIASEMIASQGYVPPGFIDMSRQGSALPLKYRKPSSPYALVTLIVNRFTGLLFSEQMHPEIQVEGDPITLDWLKAFAETTRLWQQFVLARQYGGATGSVAIGVLFVQGKPVIEIHDPRWCLPDFVEYGSTKLQRLEKRYQFPKEVQNPETGEWEIQPFWYRRIIDMTQDVVFNPVPVGDGEEPEWTVKAQVQHDLGFCPVVWIQNMPVLDDPDGDPDCPPSVYDTQSTIDTLLAQSNRGIIANCDPTVVISAKGEMAGVGLGSDNAIKLPEGGDAHFMELEAAGPKAATEQSKELKANALEVAQCVLENPESAPTATGVERSYQSMLSKADILREQYGQKGVIVVLDMAWQVAQKLSQPRMIPAQQEEIPMSTGSSTEDGVVGPSGASTAQPGEMTPGAGNAAPLPGQPPAAEAPPALSPLPPQQAAAMAPQVARVERSQVYLPPKYDTNPQTGVITKTERTLGTGGNINLKWPTYFPPSLQDINTAGTAATGALTGGILDDEAAVEFVSPFFNVADPKAMLERIRQGNAQKTAEMMAMSQPPVDPNDPDAAAPIDGADPLGGEGAPSQGAVNEANPNAPALPSQA